MKSRKSRIALGVVVLLAVLYATLAWRAQPVPNYPFFTQQDGVMVIAHQGGEWLRPSNTLVAFDHAVGLGVDVLEMDIHQTQDGVIVLMHDATVDRTTDGSGAIKEMSFAEIRALDAGHYWTDDDGATYPYRGQGIQVPTLEELFQRYPDMRMNIEIKQETPSMVRPFCQLIHDYNMEDQILVATFHQSTVEEFREECPDMSHLDGGAGNPALFWAECCRFGRVVPGTGHRLPGAAHLVAAPHWRSGRYYRALCPRGAQPQHSGPRLDDQRPRRNGTPHCVRRRRHHHG
jgi:glycerophosphoryl diester phosphodiesterase